MYKRQVVLLPSPTGAVVLLPEASGAVVLLTEASGAVVLLPEASGAVVLLPSAEFVPEASVVVFFSLYSVYSFLACSKFSLAAVYSRVYLASIAFPSSRSF